MGLNLKKGRLILLCLKMTKTRNTINRLADVLAPIRIDADERKFVILILNNAHYISFNICDILYM